jgi:nucleoside-diphosphate-sugar epimerase
LIGRVLVTGASGFIGHHLVTALMETDAEIVCLVRPTSDISRLETMGVSLIEGDVTREASLVSAVSGVDFVMHLAGATASFNPEFQRLVNEGGTKNIAEACAHSASPPTLIFVSSIAAAGPNPAGRSLKEEDPPLPVSHYGRSKLAAEEALRRWAGEMPITIVRPPIVFGEYDRDVFRMFEIVQQGWHLVPGWRERHYSIIHARDLAQGLILAAERGERLPSGERGSEANGRGIYYIAYDTQPSYAELGSLIAEALERRGVRIMHVPGFLIWIVGAVSEALSHSRGRPSIINLDKAREASAGSWTCSSEKAEDQLGFRPQVALSERLRQTGRWYQEAGWL